MSSTLVAVDLGSGAVGFITPDGSLTPDPAPNGFTSIGLYSYTGSIIWGINGNAVSALSSLTGISVDGVSIPLISTTFIDPYTEIVFDPGSAFVPGNSYTIIMNGLAPTVITGRGNHPFNSRWMKSRGRRSSLSHMAGKGLITDKTAGLSTVLIDWFFEPSSTTLYGYVKEWNGSTWVPKAVKYWNGSAWVIKPLKAWDGSMWKTYDGVG